MIYFHNELIHISYCITVQPPAKNSVGARAAAEDQGLNSAICTIFYPLSPFPRAKRGGKENFFLWFFAGGCSPPAKNHHFFSPLPLVKKGEPGRDRGKSRLLSGYFSNFISNTTKKKPDRISKPLKTELPAIFLK